MSVLWKLRISGYVGTQHWVTDPFEPALYGVDGGGTTFAALRLRKFSCLDGAELATARLGNHVRCFHFFPDGQRMLVALDKKLFILDRRTLSVLEKRVERIPAYTDFLAVSGSFILVANYTGPNMSILNWNDGKIRRLKIASCQGIFPEPGGHTFIVASGKDGTIYRVDIGSRELTTVAQGPKFTGAYYRPRPQGLLVVEGDFSTLGGSTLSWYSLEGHPGREDFRMPAPFRFFNHTPSWENVYLGTREEIREVELKTGRTVRTLTPEKGYTYVGIFPEKGFALVGRETEKDQMDALAMSLA